MRVCEPTPCFKIVSVLNTNAPDEYRSAAIYYGKYSMRYYPHEITWGRREAIKEGFGLTAFETYEQACNELKVIGSIIFEALGYNPMPLKPWRYMCADVECVGKHTIKYLAKHRIFNNAIYFWPPGTLMFRGIMLLTPDH